MTKINLNDYKNEDKEIIIFNDGNAGKVKNVRLEVTKKAPTDKENAPDFKFNYFDENDGSVNDGIYYPNDKDTEKQSQIKLSRIISVFHAISPESKDKLLPEFNDYITAVDFLIKQIIQASKNGKVNLFIAYGTVNNPQQYFRVRKFNFIESITTEDSSSRLYAKVSKDPDKKQWDDVMERMQSTSFNDSSKVEKITTEVEVDDWV